MDINEYLATTVADYQLKEVTSLREDAVKKLTDASFRESVIPAIKERQDKVKDLLLQAQKDKEKLIDDEKNDAQLSHKKEHREALKTLDNRIKAFKATIDQDDKMIDQIEEHGFNLRQQVEGLLARAKWIDENFPTKPLEDYAAHLAPKTEEETPVEETTPEQPAPTEEAGAQVAPQADEHSENTEVSA